MKLSSFWGVCDRYPDHEAGQIPMAFVVKKSNSNFCEEDVINFVAKHVNGALEFLYVSLLCLNLNFVFFCWRCQSPRENICYGWVQVSPYKKIRRVTFVNSIPKSPTGKILRKDLSHQALSTSRSDPHSQTINLCLGLPPNSTLSFLSRELREGQLHPLLGGVSSRGVAANSAVPDPLLSSFVYNLSISESNEDQIKPIVSSEESSMKKSLDVWVMGR